MGAYYTGPEWAAALLVALVLIAAATFVRWARDEAAKRDARDRRRRYARTMTAEYEPSLTRLDGEDRRT